MKFKNFWEIIQKTHKFNLLKYNLTKELLNGKKQIFISVKLLNKFNYKLNNLNLII